MDLLHISHEAEIHTLPKWRDKWIQVLREILIMGKHNS